MGCIYLFMLVFSSSLDKYSEVELLDHMVVLFLFFFQEPLYCYTKWLHFFIFPPRSAQRLSFLHILSKICYFLSFHNRYSKRYEMISQYGFDLCSLMINDVEHLFTYLLAICTGISRRYCEVFFPDHYNKMNIAIKQATWFMWFPGVHKICIYTIL